MADELRAQVRQRFNARCGYCGVHEDAFGATLTVDHHRPRVRGGTNDPDNLVYSCARCNEHKGTYWHEHDAPRVRLLNPGQDDLTQHVRENDDGHIIGMTREGEFFVQHLRLNGPQLVAYRCKCRAETALTEELVATRQRIHELERTVLDLRSTLESVARANKPDGEVVDKRGRLPSNRRRGTVRLWCAQPRPGITRPSTTPLF